MTKKIDRRILRTRGLLQDALHAMIIEKGYEAATVQDIIDRANVGRATFYAHFADKESLLLSGFADLRDVLKQQQAQSWQRSAGSAKRRFAFSVAMLEHARGHWKLYQAMVGQKSGTLVLQHVQMLVTELVRDDIEAMGVTGTTAERELVVSYVTGGFMGTMLWWLEHGADLPPSEIDARFRRMVMPGLTQELRRSAKGAVP